MFEMVKTTLYRWMGLMALIATLTHGTATARAEATSNSSPSPGAEGGSTTKSGTSSGKPAPILRFDEFQVGSKIYSNVTVISRTETDVFVKHSKGIANFKAGELSEDLQEKLGYIEAKKPEVVPDPSAIAVFARTNAILSELARRVKGGITAESGGETKLSGPLATLAALSPAIAQLSNQLPQAAMVWVSFVLVALPILYFFFCYTARLVCKKAGSEPGFLIWFPVVSLFPLVRAARMPTWTAILFLVPFVNLIVTIVWSFKIARGKSALTAFFLILPITSPGAWLYLAYSK